MEEDQGLDAAPDAEAVGIESPEPNLIRVNEAIYRTPPFVPRSGRLGGYRQFLNRNSSGQLGLNSSLTQSDVEEDDEGYGQDSRDNTIEAWEVAEKVRWAPTRKVVLFVMLVLLISVSAMETITYTVNGKIRMVPYRVFVNQLVVLACVLFFSSLACYADRSLRRAIRRRNSTVTAGQSSLRERTNSEDFGYQSLDDGDNSFLDQWADSGGRFDAGSEWDETPDPSTPFWGARFSSSTEKPLNALFMLMALCDTVSLYINLLASHNIGGSLRLILQQLSIPLSMAFSFLLLGRVFTVRHVAGASTVALGVIMCLVNVLKATPGQESDPVWTLLFIFSCVPLALGGCLKEWVLLQKRCDANFLNARVSLFQLLIGFCLVPLGLYIQNLNMPAISRVSTSEMFDNFIAGFKCGCLGITEYNEYGYPHFGQDDCYESVITTWLYVFTVCAFNLLMLWVIKEGTAVLFFVASGVTIPLVSLLSTSPLYKHLGLKPETFTPWQLLGLLLTVGGCIFFGTAMIRRSESAMQQRIIQSIRRSGSSRMHAASPRYGSQE